jgi:hypothetical protein
MILIEPPAAFDARMGKAKPATSALTTSEQPRPTGSFNESYWTGILFETLKLEGDLPMKISTLVTLAAKWGDYSCRTDREARKLALFKLIGRLILDRKLRRFSRNYVLIADRRDEQPGV